MTVLVTCVSMAQDSLAGHSIGFQVHSFNDLRQWPQLLDKGVRFFKVDLYYKSAFFCKSVALLSDS